MITLPPLLRFLPLALMATAALAAGVIGGLFFVKRSGDRRANLIYGTLLLAAGLTQFHFLFDFAGWPARWPGLRFLPTYFTLWLPVLLFFWVKVRLYPEYRLRWTDAKHLALPLAQLLFFAGRWLVPEWRGPAAGRSFYSPFYGGLEQALYLIYWPLYLFFSYQYFRRKRAALNRPVLPRLLWYIRKLLKGCGLFVLAYAILALGDFVSFKYLNADLRGQAWYAALQSLTFSILVYWLSTFGFQILLWGRKLLRG